MISLRNFTYDDIPVLQKNGYAHKSKKELQALIDTWNRNVYENSYFEMFAIDNAVQAVGCASLYRRSKSIVSCGLEVYPEYQRKGFASRAYSQLLHKAKTQGYQIAVAQVRADNEASIALNRKLGFEAEDYKYMNQRGDEIYYFIKCL